MIAPWTCDGQRRWDERRCGAKLGEVEMPMVVVAAVALNGIPRLTVKCRNCGHMNVLNLGVLQTANDHDRLIAMV